MWRTVGKQRQSGMIPTQMTLSRDAYSIMHDAWTLSRMKTMRVRLGKVVPFNEAGYTQAVDAPHLSPDNFNEYNNTEQRKLIDIRYGSDKDAHTVVQGRRLGMFIKYDNLTDDVKAQDKIPAETFFSIFNSERHRGGVAAFLRVAAFTKIDVKSALDLTRPVHAPSSPGSKTRDPTVVELREVLRKQVSKMKKPILVEVIEHADKIASRDRSLT